MPAGAAANREAKGRRWAYDLFGLRVHSDIPLTELFEADDNGAAADVVIRLGEMPAGAPDPKPGYTVAGSATLLSISKVGLYWIDSGREMIVQPFAGASERNIRLFLLGSAFGALLHQRNLLPLHANAVEIDGRAIAFMGHSGAGKSTMAAWFLDRGHRILADDVCVVTFDSAGRPLAHGGIPRLRLWREAIEATGRAAEDYELSFDDADKYNVPTPRGPSIGALPLHHIYLLRRAEAEASAPLVERLLGVDAVDALVANTYRGGFVKASGGTGKHLSQCLSLVSRAPVFKAERRWGYDSFDEQAAALEAHARQLIAATG